MMSDTSPLSSPLQVPFVDIKALGVLSSSNKYLVVSPEKHFLNLRVKDGIA